jgi:hypothetical protein
VRPSLSSAPAPGNGQCARFGWPPTSSVEESDTCMEESGRCLSSEPWCGPRPWSTPRLGMWVDAPVDRPADGDRGPGWPRGSQGPRGWLFDPYAVLGHPECQRKVGPLGPRVPGPVRGPRAALRFFLIVKPLFSLCHALLRVRVRIALPQLQRDTTQGRLPLVTASQSGLPWS